MATDSDAQLAPAPGQVMITVIDEADHTRPPPPQRKTSVQGTARWNAHGGRRRADPRYDLSADGSLTPVAEPFAARLARTFIGQG